MKRAGRTLILILCVLFHFQPGYADDITVYVTETGSKYHRESCPYLRSSKVPIALSEAIENGYEPCSRCDPPTAIPSEIEADNILQPVAYADSELLALPYYEEDDVVLFYTGFALKYNEEYEQPEWVAYLLTDDEVRGTVERSNRFRADGNIQTESASLADYRGSGYDRGHLAPAADMKWSEQAMDESFLMSNMSPQDPGFNRGMWRVLEGLVREWAIENEEVYVVTGPVLTDGRYERIGENGVAVPKRYYKVVLDYVEPELRAIGFILPNQKAGKSISDFVVSVDIIELETGLDFFHLLPDDLEESLEAQVELSNWE